MNSSSKAVSWCWRRRVAVADEETWLARLGGVPWVFTSRPGSARGLLSVYALSRPEAERLRRAWNGEVRRIDPAEWSASRPLPPRRFGRGLEVVHEAKAPRSPGVGRLVVPAGMAFGTGEHATTSMLLHALVRLRGLEQRRVLDLGTGSGILALAARRLGARRIVGTDFDPEAIRTARDNEERNFREPLIRWRRADVKRLRGRGACDLVLANLFSEILCQAAPSIAGVVAPGGLLWLSGILRSQEAGVRAAYSRQGLRLLRAARRGKWVLLEWRKTVS